MAEIGAYLPCVTIDATLPPSSLLSDGCSKDHEAVGIAGDPGQDAKDHAAHRLCPFAHYAQKEMVRYFGTNLKIDTVEIARVILQSQLSVYKAIQLAIDLSNQEHELYNKLLKEVKYVRESKAVAEELEQFIIDAHKGGIITVREAESILHPLHDHMKKCAKQIRASYLGQVGARLSAMMTSGVGSTGNKDSNEGGWLNAFGLGGIDESQDEETHRETFHASEEICSSASDASPSASTDKPGSRQSVW